jgi:hypothetical protein
VSQNLRLQFSLNSPSNKVPLCFCIFNALRSLARPAFFFCESLLHYERGSIHLTKNVYAIFAFILSSCLVFTAFSREKVEQKRGPAFAICKEKPWLCDDQNCPIHEENVDGKCRCVAGYERKAGKCNPLLP